MKHLFCLFALFVFCTFKTDARKLTDTAYINSTTVDKKAKKTSFNVSIGSEQYLFKVKNADTLSFKEKDFNDSSWIKRTAIFNNDELKKGNFGRGIAWFRLRLKADTSMIDEALALNFTGVGAMEVFLDGQLKRKVENFSNEGKASYVELSKQPVFITLDDTLIHTLAVRYEYNDVFKNEDNWGWDLKITTAANFYSDFKNANIAASLFLVGMGTIFLTLFAVHFLMFLFYKKELSNLYFSLFTLSIAVVAFFGYAVYAMETSIVNEKFSTPILACSVILCATSLSAFTATLFSRKKIFVKIILAVGVLTLMVTVIDLNVESDITSTFIGVSLLLSLGYTVIMIIIAMFKRMPGAFILGSGIVFFFLFWIGLFFWAYFASSIDLNDVLGLLALLSLMSIPLSISAFLAWRFATTNKNLSQQLITVETLSAEKQTILENQKAALEKEVVVRTQEIREEKQRSDDLLLNILPAEVAEELKLNGESKAQRYDEVSVLFTDFVNFTQTSEKMGVEQLLKELNINFTAFDHIIEKYGLEKIKTIGDAYLAVCGLPVSNLRHAQNTVNAAIEIAAFVSKRKQETPFGLDIRIGVNSGSLIAGIVGVKKFAYDIWGDTVNTAARMEQNSEAGKVNVSQATYLLIKDEFDCKHRGKVTVKGKGEMDMYFVTPKEKKETLENP